MSLFLARTWAEINLNNIEHNYNLIKSNLKPETKIMSVVKADAYGHGAKMISKELVSLGTDWFAVSNIEEALQLRGFGISKPILILGYTPPHLAKYLSENDISQTVLDEDYAKQLLSFAIKDNLKLKVHIKIDTGMGRLGFSHNDLSDNSFIERIKNSLNNDCFIAEGIFTHFATADFDNDVDGTSTKKQYDLFVDCIEKLKQEGIYFQVHHCSNSAGTLKHKDFHLDMVRPGIILYGLNPSSAFKEFDLKPAFILKSVVSMIKTVNKGDSVSYGKTFIAENNLKVATIPVGYADGYSRGLSNKGFVIINGKKANILGRVCMDQMMVDITNIEDVNVGDEVILFGDEKLTIDEYSALIDTINYETVCLVGKRVPRVYYKDGKEVAVVNFIYNKKD